MSQLIPSLQVTDPAATITWFEKLGFTVGDVMTMPDGSIMHADVNRGDNVRIMFGPPMMGGVGSAGMSLYLTIDGDIDGFHGQAQAAGVTIAHALEDQFWGDRTFAVTHPDGYMIMFAQHVRDVSPEEMQQAALQFAGASA